MIHLKTVLVPTDFSECSQAALSWAVGLARLRNAEIVLAHACSRHEDLEAARTQLERLAAGLAPLPVRAVLKQQDPVAFVVELADKFDRVLVVMGTHGRRGVTRQLLGSTAEGVSDAAPCPVLTIRHPDGAKMPDDPLKVDRILVPLDLSGASMKAFDYGAEFARTIFAEVILLHVVEHELHPVDRRAAADLLAQVSRRHPDTRARVLLEDGPVLDRIADVVREWGVGFIIQTTRGLNASVATGLGPVAAHLIRRSACPVLTVKSHEHEIVVRGEDLAESSSAP